MAAQHRVEQDGHVVVLLLPSENPENAGETSYAFCLHNTRV